MKWSTAQSGAVATADSARGTGTKKSASKGVTKAEGAGRGKFRRGNAGKRQDPKVDPCQICNKLGHWAKDCDQGY